MKLTYKINISSGCCDNHCAILANATLIFAPYIPCTIYSSLFRYSILMSKNLTPALSCPMISRLWHFEISATMQGAILPYQGTSGPNSDLQLMAYVPESCDPGMITVLRDRVAKASLLVVIQRSII